MRVILGLLLLTAAVLKALALWVGPAPPLSLFLSPRWQVAFLELETVLGLWLVSGVNPRGAWLAGVGAFGLLAGVSLYLGVVGSPSCGCFGQIEVSPWITFGVDLVALAALWGFRPRPLAPFFGSDFRMPRRYLRAGFGVAALLGAGAVVLLGLGTTPSRMLARLRGESLVIEPALADVGSGVVGEERPFTIEVRNLSDRPIRLVGGSASCNCLATRSLPLTVPAREARSLVVMARLVGPPGEGQQEYKLYTDDESQPVVLGRYGRRLLAKSDR